MDANTQPKDDEDTGEVSSEVQAFSARQISFLSCDKGLVSCQIDQSGTFGAKVPSERRAGIYVWCRLSGSFGSTKRSLGSPRNRRSSGQGNGCQGLIDEHTRDFSVLLQTLWLRRSAETSTFFGEPLTPVLPDIRSLLSCLLLAKFKLCSMNPYVVHNIGRTVVD